MKEIFDGLERMTNELALHSGPHDLVAMRDEVRQRYLTIQVPERKIGSPHPHIEERQRDLLVSALGFLEKLLRCSQNPLPAHGSNTSERFRTLVGLKLSTFGYPREGIWSLKFRPEAFLNIAAPLFFSGNARAALGDKEFSDLYVAHCGKTVKSVAYAAGDSISIVFTDDSSVFFDLKKRVHADRDAIIYFGPENDFIVA